MYSQCTVNVKWSVLQTGWGHFPIISKPLFCLGSSGEQRFSYRTLCVWTRYMQRSFAKAIPSWMWGRVLCSKGLALLVCQKSWLRERFSCSLGLVLTLVQYWCGWRLFIFSLNFHNFEACLNLSLTLVIRSPCASWVVSSFWNSLANLWWGLKYSNLP